MAVALHSKSKSWPIGTGDLLGSFFDTIAANLEDGQRGKIFPYLNLEFYSGTLPADHVKGALKELEKVEKELAALPPEKMIWDMDSPQRKPPWGDSISPNIKSLRDYYVTSDGEDLIDTIKVALGFALRTNSELIIK